MNSFSLNVPDDWLALAWCAVAMGLSLLIVYLAGQIHRKPDRPAPVARSRRPLAARDLNTVPRLRLPPSNRLAIAAPRFRVPQSARPRLTARRRFDI